MRNILRTFVLFAVMATLSSCNWFETDNAGDLEGLWHVRSVEFKADGTKTDLSSERYYWAFQKKLLQMENKEGKAETIQVKKNLVKDIVEELNRQGRGVVMNEIEFKSLEKLG